MTEALGLPLEQATFEGAPEIVETASPRRSDARGTLRVVRGKDGVITVARFRDAVEEGADAAERSV